MTRRRGARLAATAAASSALALAAGLGFGQSAPAEAERWVGLRLVGPVVGEASVRAYEHLLRSRVDFASRPPRRGALGADPYGVAAFGDHRVAVSLRGEDALVLLDETGAELARATVEAPGPLGALPGGGVTGVDGRGRVFVAREEAGALSLAWPGDEAGRAAPRAELSLPTPGGALLAVARGAVVDAAGGAPTTLPIRRPHRAVASARHAVVLDALAHTIVALPLDGEGLPTGEVADDTRHGLLYGLDAVADGAATFVVGGGLEDHALDRTGGSFGYVDSHAFVWRAEGARLERCGEVNLSAHGVVTPKVVTAWIERGALVAEVWGAGSGTRARLTFGAPRCPLDAPDVEVLPGVVGATAAAPRADGGWLVASPLLDGVWAVGALEPALEVFHPASRQDATRSASSHLGEALLFTTLMAPWQRSDGELSRFTCEACHLEGGTDGRVHATGRGSVHANTKPLWGLFNNAPHFSRALDRDTTRMVFAEFRVAAARGDAPAWFELERAPVSFLEQLPWIDDVGGSPLAQRRAVVDFLADFTHETSPATRGRAAFDATEARGAEVFGARCATCHAPRLIADDPASEVPPARWQELVLSEAGPIVWARDGWEATGVLPYVHPQGARPTSLRRVASRSPLFTNGSAASLDEVLARAAWDAGRFVHDGAPSGAERLDADDAAALLAFLRLL